MISMDVYYLFVVHKAYEWLSLKNMSKTHHLCNFLDKCFFELIIEMNTNGLSVLQFQEALRMTNMVAFRNSTDYY